MTLLTLINNVQDKLKLPRSSSVITNTDTQTRQLLGLANDEGYELNSAGEWPYLRKFCEIVLVAATGTDYLGTFAADSTTVAVNTTAGGVAVGMNIQGNGIPVNTIVTAINGLNLTINYPTTEAGAGVSLTFGQFSYSLPNDFDRVLNDTEWDQTNRWAAIGPNSAQDWAWMTQGIVALTPRRHYRIMGNDTTQFFIWPVPGPTENGNIMTFEYTSKVIALPQLWVTNTVYAANATVSYGGRRYTTTGGGTSGSSPPVQWSGTVSDGGVSWTYADNGYTQFQADTDITVLTQKLYELGLQWRWKRANGFPYTDDEMTYENARDRALGRQPGAPVLSLSRRRYNPLIGPWNVQDGNFPGPV